MKPLALTIDKNPQDGQPGVTLLLFLHLVIFFLMFICNDLKGRVTEREEISSYTGLLPKCPQQPGLDPIKARSPELHRGLHFGGSSPSI